MRRHQTIVRLVSFQIHFPHGSSVTRIGQVLDRGRFRAARVRGQPCRQRRSLGGREELDSRAGVCGREQEQLRACDHGSGTLADATQVSGSETSPLKDMFFTIPGEFFHWCAHDSGSQRVRSDDTGEASRG